METTASALSGYSSNSSHTAAAQPADAPSRSNAYATVILLAKLRIAHETVQPAKKNGTKSTAQKPAISMKVNVVEPRQLTKPRQSSSRMGSASSTDSANASAEL